MWSAVDQQTENGHLLPEKYNKQRGRNEDSYLICFIWLSNVYGSGRIAWCCEQKTKKKLKH